uniref:Uncharacterized protein n=1 Tax=Salix viminalis TaxID=40686 RepID=A0A6N2M935_SALVM
MNPDNSPLSSPPPPPHSPHPPSASPSRPIPTSVPNPPPKFHPNLGKDDPKTLTCLQIEALSLRFFCPGEVDSSLPCSQSHFHIRHAALPAIMKVLANLKSLEIKLCDSLLQLHHHLATVVDPELDVQLCAVVDVGALSLRTLWSRRFGFSFCDKIKLHRPQTLRSILILSANMKGFRSVRERTYNNPQNVMTCWLKSQSNIEEWIIDEVWLAFQQDFFWMYVEEITDVKELLAALSYKLRTYETYL